MEVKDRDKEYLPPDKDQLQVLEMQRMDAELKLRKEELLRELLSKKRNSEKRVR